MRKTAVFCRVLCLALLLAFFSPLSSAARANLPDGYFTREQLAQLLAPIALYPDPLLSQILIASTYPIEVIEADRWLGSRRGIEGDALDRALLEEDWDPSVKALCHFPSVLGLMSEKITQTTDLGNAFLAQEGEVMAMIQELRDKAHARGHLTTTAQQTVIVKKETIIIAPANPRFIYVPYYDPFYVYGPWWYPAYPPYYWAPAGVRIGLGIHYWPRVYFHFSYTDWCYFDWPRRVIHIDVHKRPRFVRADRWFDRPGRWQHAPEHRRGLAYRDRGSIERYERPGRHPGAGRHELHRPAERGRSDRDRQGDRPAVDRHRPQGRRPDVVRDEPGQVSPPAQTRQVQGGDRTGEGGGKQDIKGRTDDGRRKQERGKGERAMRGPANGRLQSGEKAVDGQPALENAGREGRGRVNEEDTRSGDERARNVHGPALQQKRQPAEGNRPRKEDAEREYRDAGENRGREDSGERERYSREEGRSF